ncbi:MAG: translation initiation factor IF-2 [Spirochaetales bacterium]|nr:translation initiation factor IF-2 [Spirochaetales bacterium]
MAEDTKKDKKPKTALIKQKKQVEKQSGESDKTEKKKVVVVKKKVVVVKKKAPEKKPEEKKPADRKESAARTTPNVARRPPDRTHGDRQRDSKRPFEPRRNTNDKFRPSGTGHGQGQGQGQGPRRFSSQRGPDNKFGNRTGKPGGGPDRRPSSGGKPKQSGGFTSSTTDEKKTGARRFIKAKKKPIYQRTRHEEHEEKLLIAAKKKAAAQKANPIPKEINIMEVITVSDLARKMNLKASELISKLMGMGMMVTINQQIDAETAQIIADEYGCSVKILSLYDETVIEEDDVSGTEFKHRPPIVTVMGHVDHGKTKLLDAIREADVVGGEHGGITQHIGAYSAHLDKGIITFLDTPGHEAFTLMRARGAQVTDIVILVVSAADGVMPQTIEAINHAKEAKVPIIVAVNKIDLPEANVERVKQQLSEYELLSEDWGGHTLFCEISALQRLGINELLDAILLQSEMLELNAIYDCKAKGRVLESRIDHGRGIVATVLIQQGTLKVGDPFVAGIFPGKVRAMFNDKGEKVTVCTPSIPVEILGFEGIPNAGDPFQMTDTEKTARQVGVKRQELKKLEEAKNVKKITLDNLYDQIKQGEIQELKVIIKGDVHGSVEALRTSLEKLTTEEIRLVVIHSAAGAINDKDVILASASNAIIIGFHVRPSSSALVLAEREKVEIKKYSIIYDAVDQIRSAMEGMLKPELREETIGVAEVRETFKVPKIGVIAGCYVTSGTIRRNAEANVVRDGVEIFRGKITSLKRFKDDAKEVETGFECGIGIDNFNDLKIGDNIEAIEIKEIAKKLKAPGAKKSAKDSTKDSTKGKTDG